MNQYQNFALSILLFLLVLSHIANNMKMDIVQIFLILIHLHLVCFRIIFLLCHVALVHLVARPSLRLLLDVPLHGIVHLAVSGLVYEDKVFRRVADARELIPAIFIVLIGGVTVGVGCCFLFVVRTCCESQHGKKA